MPLEHTRSHCPESLYDRGLVCITAFKNRFKHSQNHHCRHHRRCPLSLRRAGMRSKSASTGTQPSRLVRTSFTAEPPRRPGPRHCLGLRRMIWETGRGPPPCQCPWMPWETQAQTWMTWGWGHPQPHSLLHRAHIEMGAVLMHVSNGVCVSPCADRLTPLVLP